MRSASPAAPTSSKVAPPLAACCVMSLCSLDWRRARASLHRCGMWTLNTDPDFPCWGHTEPRRSPDLSLLLFHQISQGQEPHQNSLKHACSGCLYFVTRFGPYFLPSSTNMPFSPAALVRRCSIWKKVDRRASFCWWSSPSSEGGETLVSSVTLPKGLFIFKRATQARESWAFCSFKPQRGSGGGKTCVGFFLKDGWHQPSVSGSAGYQRWPCSVEAN